MTASARLAARYRLWMLSYPRSYRRERGEEMITIMLDLAPPGKTRPAAKERLNLLRHGFRARLGRPASRAIVVWASVVSVLCGLFLASAATFAAWQTAEPLPSRPEAEALFSSLLPGYEWPSDRLQVSPDMFVVYTEPLGWRHFDSLISGDGGELTFGDATIYADATAGKPADVVDRLRTSGWEISGPTARYGETLYLAQRGNDIVEVSAGSGFISITLLRDTPWLVYPAGVAAFLVGALLAFMTFGWASRRTEHRHPVLRAPATFLFGTTMFFWCLPLYAVPFLLVHHIEERHIRWHPIWEFLGQPSFSMFFLAGCMTAFLGLAFVAAPSRRRIVSVQQRGPAA